MRERPTPLYKCARRARIVALAQSHSDSLAEAAARKGKITKNRNRINSSTNHRVSNAYKLQG